ncbi:MAG: glycosyltransferase [Candidatus Sericytochromatia bacterium]|nr:glycosyltransferase [Candidatus Sericytochromatia bacterium]
MPTLTLCAIVRNEAANIARMIGSVWGLVDAMVILDTGSTDDTVAIARSLGATVHVTEWPGSFAEARNQAIALCDADWILSLDGDEALEVSHHDEVRRQIADPDRHVVMVELINYLAGNHTSRFHYPRLYRREPAIRYAGKVHNQLVYPYTAGYAPILIHHWGYLRTGQARLVRLKQTLALCEEAVAEGPMDPAALYYLAQTQFQLGDFHAAVANSERVLQLLPDGYPPAGSMLGETYFKLAYFWFLAAEPDKAAFWIHRGLTRGGNQIDLHFLGGRVYRSLRPQPQTAIGHWQGYLAALSARMHGDRRDRGQSTYFDTHEGQREAWQGLAAAFAGLGQPAETAAVLSEWAALMPEDPEPVAQQVWLELANGRPEQAHQRMRSLPATLSRSDSLIAAGMVAALRTQGVTVEADVRRLLAAPPYRWLLWEHFARWLVAQGRQAAAVEALAVWQRWLPGDRRVGTLRAALDLPDGRPATSETLTAALTVARHSGPATAMTALEAVGQAAANEGDRALALWAAAETWARQPDAPALRSRYLSLRPAGPDRDGRRLLVSEPPSKEAVALLLDRMARADRRLVSWHRRLGPGEAAMVIGPMPATEQQTWLAALAPLGVPVAVALDLSCGAAPSWAAGLVAVPILPGFYLPNPGEPLLMALARWRTVAADALATHAVVAGLSGVVPLQLGQEGHCDLSGAVLQDLGVIGVAHTTIARLEAGFWLACSPAHASPSVDDTVAWAWVFPAGGMWLRRPPLVASGPAPVPDSLVLAGQSCPITPVAGGWSAILPDVMPGYYEITAHVAGQSVIWWFGCSNWA